MDGSDGVNSMEVIIILDGGLLVLHLSAHDLLTLRLIPGRSVKASGVTDAVNLSRVVAWGLHVVVTFLLHGVEEGSQDFLRVSGRDLLRGGGGFVDNDLNEVTHGLSNLLMGNSLGHLRSQVVLFDVAGRGAGTELHVRDTFKGDNWEHPVLSALNVVSCVVPSFGNAGDT